MTGDKEPTPAAALAMRGAPDLGLRWFGFHFADPVIEQRYHQWDIDRKIPLIRVGMAASAAGYAVYLLSAFLLVPDNFDDVLPAVAAFLGLLGAIFVSTYWEKMRAFWVPLTAAANCISGMLLAIQLHEIIDAEARYTLAATAVLIPVMFGFCVYQFSPVWAMAATLPFIVLSLFLLYADLQAGYVSQVLAGGLAAMQFIACNTGVFVSAVIEFNNRRTFRKDQIIDLQRLQLKESRDAIRRYVPPSVADLIIRGESDRVDTPIRRRITVLFADMVGFTEVADRIEPEELTQLLSDYLSGMAQKVEKFGGTLNEFAGDGLMALFGAPMPLDPQAQASQAISAALEMQVLMSELNEGWRRLGLGRPLKIRIGIHTGTVSVGSYGSAGRMTYTAFGLQTNIASRIERAAEPGAVLISEPTFHLAGGGFCCEPRGEVDCKGIHYPVNVFTVLPQQQQQQSE